MSLIAQPPLGPPPVQTPPGGWLGLLGIKSGGVQPGQVNPTLSPTIEMLPFYRAGGRTRLFTPALVAAAQNSFSPGAAGGISTVPQGKIWIVEWAVSVSTVLGVAANVTANIEVQDTDGFSLFFGPQSQLGLTGAVVIARLDTPIIMMPGTKLGTFCSAPAAITAFNWTVIASGMEVSA